MRYIELTVGIILLSTGCGPYDATNNSNHGNEAPAMESINDSIEMNVVNIHLVDTSEFCMAIIDLKISNHTNDKLYFERRMTGHIFTNPTFFKTNRGWTESIACWYESTQDSILPGNSKFCEVVMGWRHAEEYTDSAKFFVCFRPASSPDTKIYLADSVKLGVLRGYNLE